MLVSRIISGLALAAAAVAAVYGTDDKEIFSTQASLVEDSHRADYDFYKFLRLPDGPKSSPKDIEKHYRQLSRKWHPDKYRDAKAKHRAEKRFQKLGLVMGILRDHEKKQKYDYYLKRGFPRYNEKTGQYVFRHGFKPGFLTTVGIVVVIVSVLQWLVLKVNYRQNYKRLDSLIGEVRSRSLDPAGQQGDLPDFSTKIVPYQHRLFVVKPDRTVWLYNGDTDTEEDVKEAVAELQKELEINTEKQNRKQRRAAAKAKKHEDAPETLLLPVTTDEVAPVRLSSLLVVKIFLLPYTLARGVFKK